MADSAFLANSNHTYDLMLLDYRYQITLVILYSSTAIMSLVSNCIVIYILLRDDHRLNIKLGSEICKYLINLSITDILLALFSIPFSYTSFMLGHWIFFPWLCPVVEAVQLCSVFVSVYTLTVIGFGRYFAIIYPFHSLVYLKTHKLQILSLIWILGILFSSTQLIKCRAVPFKYGNQTLYECKELRTRQEGRNFTVIIFIVTFLLPVSLLIFVYVSIGLHIMRSKAPGNPHMARDMIQWNLKVKVVKMLIIIVIVFVLCWLPIHLFNIIVWFYPLKLDTSAKYIAYAVSFFICHWLAMAHSFLNPFIYGLMSENFKMSFRKLFNSRFNTESRFETKLEKLSNLTMVVSKTDSICNDNNNNNDNDPNNDQSVC